MNEAVIFVVQMAFIFLLGIQSRNVRDGDYFGAAITSAMLGIGGCLITPMLVHAAIVDKEPSVLIAYILAGPCGITLAMWTHDKWSKKSNGKKWSLRLPVRCPDILEQATVKESPMAKEV